MLRVVNNWTFLSTHAHVLLCVARDPQARLRTIADAVGLTERAAHRIVSELVDAGYLTKHRVGRRNVYEVHPDRPMRHPLNEEYDVAELLRVFLTRPGEENPSPPSPKAVPERNGP